MATPFGMAMHAVLLSAGRQAYILLSLEPSAVRCLEGAHGISMASADNESWLAEHLDGSDPRVHLQVYRFLRKDDDRQVAIKVIERQSNDVTCQHLNIFAEVTCLVLCRHLIPSPDRAPTFCATICNPRGTLFSMLLIECLR